MSLIPTVESDLYRNNGTVYNNILRIDINLPISFKNSNMNFSYKTELTLFYK